MQERAPDDAQVDGRRVPEERRQELTGDDGFHEVRTDYCANRPFPVGLRGPRESSAGRPRMAAAAFYDLDGTLVRTNLVHAFAFTARNQQGLLKSVVKTATTMASVPMFLAADFWNRRLFNDLFFVRYRGESEDRLRAMAQELFDTVLKPSIFPAPTSSSTNRVSSGCARSSSRAPSTSRCSPWPGTSRSTTM